MGEPYRLPGAALCLLWVLLAAPCCGVGSNNGRSGLFSSFRAPPAKVNYREEEKKIMDQVMGAEIYDARIRPSGINKTDDPTTVQVNIFVRSFSKIDDVKMEYSFQITMRQAWQDTRLQYENILRERLDLRERIYYLTLADASKVWMPDTFFRNEKFGSFHNILQPNLYIRIYPDGMVLYSIRVSLTCACSMHLALFPLDEQTCHLNIASYGWAKDDLVYEWIPVNPVQMPRNLSLPGGFKLGGPPTHEYCDVITTTGEYSCLQVNLKFARQLSFFIVTVYVPCVMTVTVSWMSFWLDHKAVPARVALGVTTLLAMSTTQAGIQNSLPPVAYTKAIDVWSGVCVFFVFSALLEYALVNYASRSDAQRSIKQKERREQDLEHSVFNAAEMIEEQGGFNVNMDPLIRRLERSHLMPPAELSQVVTCGQHTVVRRPSRTRRLTAWIQNFEFQAKKIDVFSRFGFPGIFFLFNVWYWSYYLTRKQGKPANGE